MKHFLHPIFLLICLLINVKLSFAQVHVRGYYRSNGTYVQSHERTRPNNTITDNYSYPGNYNPNTGTITGGNYYAPPTSAGSSQSSANYRNPYTITPNSKSNRPDAYVYSGRYQYRTKFDSSIAPPLRSAPTPIANEVYSCPLNANVYVIEDIPETIYCKASVNGHIGYISKSLLSINSSDVYYDNSDSRTKSSPSEFRFKTYFNNPGINPPLRDNASVTANEVYSCPTDAAVYVLEDTPGSGYCKVYVNGYTGFVSKALLAKQP
ncbi:hypothetical protein [Hymenobacter sp. PAMC 26628]|uniref:hypothetical protein n=1 Tax=Hymenobacter sp. PAMC 26628 TaxID=1484118 RepID=UPI000B126604|nr:hypothetical protein [Hymenobacter sp. PAMC 26628]